MSADAATSRTELSEATERLVNEAGATRRVNAALILIAVQLLLEVFDFFIIGFLVAVIAPAWKLSFGETAVILLAGGLGTLIGSLVAGRISDLVGRKPVFVTGGVLFAACAGLIAFVPEGNWAAFALLRFGVGVGYGGAGIAQIAFMSEILPKARRTFFSSLLQVPISIGLLLASLTAALLLEPLGWRGVAALGTLPILVSVLQAIVSPESLRWQIATGRTRQARASLENLLGRPVEEPTMGGTVSAQARRPARFADVLRYPRACALVVLVFFFAGVAVNGILLWGPTILAHTLSISPAEAAGAFVLVSITGILGRISFSFMPTWWGRRRAGQIMGFGGAIVMAVAATFHNDMLFGFSVFYVAIVLSGLFFDGGYANLQPLPPEIFPIELAATGTGLAHGAGGAAKLITPVVLALIAGVSNMVKPATTQEATFPGMLLVAGALLAVGLSFTFLYPVQARRRARRLGVVRPRVESAG